MTTYVHAPLLTFREATSMLTLLVSSMWMSIAMQMSMMGTTMATLAMKLIALLTSS